MKQVVIVGGGIIGLCTAYYLNDAGYDVTVIDKDGFAKGASHVNAGYICPSHLMPLTAPGVVSQGIKWMFNSESPLFIKPQLSLNFINWSLAFIRKANQKHVDQSIPLIKQLALSSQSLFQDIYARHHDQVAIEKKGILMLCKTEHSLAHEIELAELAKREGLEVSVLDRKAVQALEPSTEIDVLGGTHFHCDWHMTPHRFMDWLQGYLSGRGVKLVQAEVKDIKIANHKISKVITDQGEFEADDYIVAAGAWSRILAKKMNESLKLVPGKGYSINVTKPTGISIPAILIERKVAITPMQGFTRFAGTMEIGELNYDIASQRVKAVAKSAAAYYPNLAFEEEEIQQAKCGLRPVSHDGLPYIGRSSKVHNAIIATGHGMMGWTFGPITGVLVRDLVDGNATPFDINGLRLNR